MTILQTRSCNVCIIGNQTENAFAPWFHIQPDGVAQKHNNNNEKIRHKQMHMIHFSPSAMEDEKEK